LCGRSFAEQNVNGNDDGSRFDHPIVTSMFWLLDKLTPSQPPLLGKAAAPSLFRVVQVFLVAKIIELAFLFRTAATLTCDTAISSSTFPWSGVLIMALINKTVCCKGWSLRVTGEDAGSRRIDFRMNATITYP
jgi:hypothetical protein